MYVCVCVCVCVWERERERERERDPSFHHLSAIQSHNAISSGKDGLTKAWVVKRPVEMSVWTRRALRWWDEPGANEDISSPEMGGMLSWFARSSDKKRFGHHNKQSGKNSWLHFHSKYKMLDIFHSEYYFWFKYDFGQKYYAPPSST